MAVPEGIHLVDPYKYGACMSNEVMGGGGGTRFRDIN